MPGMPLTVIATVVKCISIHAFGAECVSRKVSLLSSPGVNLSQSALCAEYLCTVVVQLEERRRFNVYGT